MNKYRPLSVLQISHGIYPFSQAGTEIYTSDLASALITQGISVTVAVPASAKSSQAMQSGGLPSFAHPIERVPPSLLGNKLRYATFRGPFWKCGLRDLVRGVSPDVIHVQHAAGFGLSALGLLAKLQLPLIITLPDYWLLCPSTLRGCQGNLARCVRECCSDVRIARSSTLAAAAYLRHRRRWVHRFVHRYRPTMVAISDATRRIFLDAAFPGELLITQTWGINTAQLGSPAPPSDAGPRIGYIGSVRPHKGCHILLNAFKQLKPGNMLAFHGGGDAAYLEQLKGAAADHNVQFHGSFDHASIGTILSTLEIVVVPSLWDETYCLVAQEAMAAKKIVVVSNVGGMADRVIHGINGFLVPPNDASALAVQLQQILERFPTLTTTLDFHRCIKTIETDASEWINIYQAAIDRYNAT